MTQTREFSPVVIERLNYYVYVLRDPETHQVFYVGKGVGNRIFAHVNAALERPLPSDKISKILAIQAKGLEVEHLVHRHDLTEKEALEVEAALIDFIGLSDLTNLVLGYNSDDRGWMTVEEIIAKYEAKPAIINEPSILITVNRFYRRGMNPEELYEIVRGKWVLGQKRSRAMYAFAVYKGIIREVYEIIRWTPAEIGDEEVIRSWVKPGVDGAEVKRKKRWQFEGRIAKNLRHYVNSSTINYQTVGSQNPIRYINIS